MKLRRYNKTEMSWNCQFGFGTDILAACCGNEAKKQYYQISNLVATSLPDREGKVELTIRGTENAPKAAKRICKILHDGLHEKSEVIFRSSRGKGGFSVKRPEQFSSMYTILLRLENGDHFCDVTLETVRAVLCALGIADEGARKLADFSCERETFVKLDGVWIPYDRWLRISHQTFLFNTKEIVAMATGKMK